MSLTIYMTSREVFDGFKLAVLNIKSTPVNKDVMISPSLIAYSMFFSFKATYLFISNGCLHRSRRQQQRILEDRLKACWFSTQKKGQNIK